jgi:hypothetical protein
MLPRSVEHHLHLLSTAWESAMEEAPLKCRDFGKTNNAQWGIIVRLKQQYGNEAFLISRVSGVGD